MMNLIRGLFPNEDWAQEKTTYDDTILDFNREFLGYELAPELIDELSAQGVYIDELKDSLKPKGRSHVLGQTMYLDETWTRTPEMLRKLIIEELPHIAQGREKGSILMGLQKALEFGWWGDKESYKHSHGIFGDTIEGFHNMDEDEKNRLLSGFVPEEWKDRPQEYLMQEAGGVGWDAWDLIDEVRDSLDVKPLSKEYFDTADAIMNFYDIINNIKQERSKEYVKKVKQ
jgi:hypothetical protein